MADQSQLETALINADKAGDTAAATTLAQEIKKIRTPQSAADKATSALGLNPISKDNLMQDISHGIDKVKTASGDLFAATSKPPGIKQTREQDAQREAKSRSVGEAVPDFLATLIPVGGEEKAAAEVSDTVKAAKDYVSKHTSLSWDSLTQEFKDRLGEVAKDSKGFDKLDPKAVERQGKLNSLPKPITTATKGQLTRDPLQQRTEQLLKSTTSGNELRQMDVDSNKALLDNLDILKKGTGGKTETDLQAGRSAQGALREGYAKAQQNVSKLYKVAEDAGELQGPVKSNKLIEYAKNHIDPQQIPYVTSRLKALNAFDHPAGDFQMSLKELETIRQAAVAAGKSGGTPAHYASEVKGIIDDIEKGAGGKAFQAARKARAAVGEEYERTGAISRLVQNKKMSPDRATALEDTWQRTIKSGSLEDLQKVKTSLLKSPNGKQAWDDLRGNTIDYIKSKATGGKAGLTNEGGDLNATWSGIKRAVDDIGQDKLKEMFGEKVTKQINDIVDAAQILKTEPPTGVKGSPTIDKLMTLLDKIPIVGWVASTAKKVVDIGKAGAETRAAKITPIEEASKKPSNLLKNIKRATPAGAVLLSEQDPP